MKNTVSFFLILFVNAGYAQITSSFDADTDGWTFMSVFTPVSVTHQSSGGQPGGYASVTYSSNAGATVQNWIAPAKFRGNHLAKSFGMQLRFDLQQSVAGTLGGYDVLIRSNSYFINYTLPVKPAVAPAWSSYSLSLDDNTAWKNQGTANNATRALIGAILANVTSIEIRGTYATNGAYTSGIDNVILEQRTLTPAPRASSVSSTSGKAGDVITITGTGFSANASENVVAFGALASAKGLVQAATPTSLTVVVPAGAVYGPITITNAVTGLSSKTTTSFNPVFEGGGRIIPASYGPRFSISTLPNEGWFVGDIDGDGWDDLAVGNNDTEDAIEVYRNLGAGGDLSAASFAAKVTIPMPPVGGSGANGTGVYLADVNGDGKLDLISSTHSASGAYFVTFRNTSTPGSISFDAPEYWAGGSDETPISLVADLDGDGRPELLAGEGSFSNSSRYYFWAVQNLSTPGNIEFGPAIVFFNGTVINGFAGSAYGDLNGDGKPELIVCHNFASFFSVLTNTSQPGNPSFDNSFTLGTNQYIRGVLVADMNGDGKNDMVYKISGETGVHIRPNADTDGLLTAADFDGDIVVTGDLSTGGGIALADVNGDGKVDIVATDGSDLGVFENVYTGGAFTNTAFIAAWQVLGTGGLGGWPSVSDFNRDGKPDFAVATAGAITIIQNKNVVGPHIAVNTVSPLKGPVGSTVKITGSNFSAVATENEVYFGAVKATILTSTPTEITVSVPPGANYAPVSVRRGELTSRYRLPFVTTFSAGVTFSNAHFGAPVNFTLTNANYDIEIGDLNRDGKPDILAEANGGYAFRNTHNLGAIATSSLLVDDTLSAGSFLNPRLEDFDGDGFLDAASVNGLAHRNASTPSEISFQPSVTVGLGGEVLDVADFNNDGKMDFAVTVDLSGTGDLVVRENRSHAGAFTTGTYGTFSGNIVFNKSDNGGGVVTEDFDGDGFADVITANPDADNISIHRNLGGLKISNAQFVAQSPVATGDYPYFLYTGDLDSDGKVDLLVSHWTGTATALLIVFHNTSTPGNISFNRIDITNPSVVTISTIADLDGDGKPEIITTSESGNRFSIFKNIHTSGALSAASFAAPFNTTVTAPRGITTGDLNLDGKPEIIITRAAGLLVVYENLISPVSAPTISSFTPASGPVGTTVTITGTNFSATAANNSVTFNGTAAVVSASSATSITVTVPAGATTGPIAVTVAGNTATSATNFTVTTPAITINSQASPASVCDGGSATFTISASGTTNITYRWQYAPVSTGVFADINNGGGYANVTTASLTVNTTGNFGAGFYRCKVNGDVAATVFSNAVALVINSVPTVTPQNGERCGAGSVTLSASGGADGSYKWYTSSSSAANIPGEVNSAFTTPVLTTSATYYVSASNGLCEGERTPVTATINQVPTVTATGANACPGSAATLQASGGNNGAYAWYADATTASAIPGATNSTYQTPPLTQTTSYFVTVTANGCESQRVEVPATVITSGCGPDIDTAPLTTFIEGTIVIDLKPLIATAGILDVGSIKVIAGPPSGARAGVENGILTIDYAGVIFSGNEQITVEACNTNGLCGQQVFTIEVSGDIVIYNAVSPNGDGKNEFFFLQYIESIPSTSANTVSIYNRWGDEVFSVSDYDNNTRVFTGTNKRGSKLPAGTYYYKIQLPLQNKTLTGYLSVKY